MKKHQWFIASAALLVAAPAGAQFVTCKTGPGAAYGVTAYQCPSCGINNERPGRITIQFQAEPVIQQVSAESSLKSGDVIEAVDGSPILTVAGAELFTYPTAGAHTITLRRDGARIQVAATTLDGCPKLPGDFWQYGHEWQPNFTSGYVARFGRDTIIWQPSWTSDMSRFGFAVGCNPSCKQVKGNRADYWAWTENPLIVAVRPRSPAANAGLQIGDRVTHIDGASILSEEGIKRFQRAIGADNVKDSTMRITVLRDGRSVEFTLRVGS